MCLDRLIIADLFGSGLVMLADVIRLDFLDYPNIARWLDGTKSLPNWPRVNAGFYVMVESCRSRRSWRRESCRWLNRSVIGFGLALPGPDAMVEPVICFNQIHH